MSASRKCCHWLEAGGRGGLIVQPPGYGASRRDRRYRRKCEAQASSCRVTKQVLFFAVEVELFPFWKK